MNAEPPFASFQLEHEPWRPGPAKRLPKPILDWTKTPMNILVKSTIVLSVSLLTTRVYAQADTWKPSRLPGFSFEDAGIAKRYLNSDGEEVLGVVSFENKMRDVAYTVRIPVDDGGVREVTKTRTELLGFAERRIEVPIQHAKVWKLSGEFLSAEEVEQMLSSAKKCLVSQRNKRLVRESDNMIDDFYRKFFRDEVIVVWYDKSKAKEISSPADQP